MNNNQTQIVDGKQSSPYCTKTFEVSGTQVQNSYCAINAAFWKSQYEILPGMEDTVSLPL